MRSSNHEATPTARAMPLTPYQWTRESRMASVLSDLDDGAGDARTTVRGIA